MIPDLICTMSLADKMKKGHYLEELTRVIQIILLKIFTKIGLLKQLFYAVQKK